MFATLLAYKNAAIGLLVLGLLAGIGVQTARLEQAEAKAAVLVAQADNLRADIAAQNAGIQAVRARAAAQQEGALVAAKAAQKALTRAEARASRLEHAPVPQTCPDALQFLIDDAAVAQ